ncbi:MAG: FtsW/RodA/SpoVE family cell cycle protein, partial [Ectothiorhodospiraceae bacterium]
MWLSNSEPLSISGSRQLSFVQSRLHLDGPLVMLLALLGAFGLVVLYSAFGQDLGQVEKQFIRLLVAFGAMLVIAQIPPASLRRWTPWLYAAGVAMLVAVLYLGVAGGGATRWLDLGILRFQPSEVMKLAIPMMLSAFLADSPLPPRWTRVLASLALILIPAGLIAVQPDLGTALLVAASGFFVLFLSGLGWWLIGGAVVCALGAAPLLWFFVMHDYQRQRVLTFLNPELDPLGAGYHIIQSKIAIGSGGLFGKGWLNGT